jgi:hypothetical protein
VSSKPWKTITLNNAQSVEWKPILKELVNVQRNQRSNKTFIVQSSGRIMIPVTIPFPELGKGKWSSVIDRFLKTKYLKEQKDANDAPSTPVPTTESGASDAPKPQGS